MRKGNPKKSQPKATFPPRTFHGKFPTAHKSAEHDPEGEEHGPDPTCGDFQELHGGEEHMEISALLLAPFIPWHGAEDATRTRLQHPWGALPSGFPRWWDPPGAPLPFFSLLHARTSLSAPEEQSTGRGACAASVRPDEKHEHMVTVPGGTKSHSH